LKILTIRTTDPNTRSHQQTLNAVVRPQVGIAFSTGFGGKTSSTVFLHVRGDAMDNQGLMSMAVDLEKIVMWMIEEKNWNVPVTRFVKCL
jgi:hypothetical protein